MNFQKEHYQWGQGGGDSIIMLTGHDSIFLNSDWAKLQHFRYALVYLFTFKCSDTIAIFE